MARPASHPDPRARHARPRPGTAGASPPRYATARQIACARVVEDRWDRIPAVGQSGRVEQRPRRLAARSARSVHAMLAARHPQLVAHQVARASPGAVAARPPRASRSARPCARPESRRPAHGPDPAAGPGSKSEVSNEASVPSSVAQHSRSESPGCPTSGSHRERFPPISFLARFRSPPRRAYTEASDRAPSGKPAYPISGRPMPQVPGVLQAAPPSPGRSGPSGGSGSPHSASSCARSRPSRWRYQRHQAARARAMAP
jgi:hypothetical protein